MPGRSASEFAEPILITALKSMAYELDGGKHEALYEDQGVFY